MGAYSVGLLGVAVAVTVLVAATPAASAPRAFFVFGDSLVDNGNNNYLMTTARADAPPYGIDFPTHMPTGRFSNGLNIPDIISEHLGSQPALPYLSPDLRGENLLVGANFASAGVGILNDTGIQFVNIIRIGQQLQNFQDYQQKLAAFAGDDAARQLVEQSLVLITLGGNDFVNNYYLVPFSVRSRQFALEDYVPYLISEYKKILTRLHGLGARRVVVTGTGMIGCVPAELALHSLDGECATDLTRAADLFNPQLESMLVELNGELGGGRDVFIAANTNKISFDFMFNPQDYGFVTAKVACCGQGPYNGIGLCTPASNVCANRDVYAYWDAFHPTERANRLIVNQLMHGSTEHINPMNISTILAMDERN
ncbi:hypothetical protein GUJ93_ZPchr0014g47063 [Zizania palustris]|uniref:Uncharacterized protein n=1 Tax=Zizania palustris TaxID=103762 RepID=A0A8J5TGR8_ZIZPA|nr:hypothetical protein GUJ93_ZPchr0014g47063 [Zizania palustris]